MNIVKIAHIGIAVNNMDEAKRFFQEIFGLKVTYEETLPEFGVRTAFLQVGNSEVELLAPIGLEGPVAEHLKAKGEGLHHMAFLVKDIKRVVEDLKKNVWLINDEPKTGAKGMKVCFLLPISTNGVLIELIESD